MKIEATPRNKAAKLALEIYRQTLAQIRGDRLVQEHVSLDGDRLLIDDLSFHLSEYKRVIVAGAGKASVAMAQGIEEVLGDRVDSGLVITKVGHSEPLHRCRILEAGHPVPDANSLHAGQEMLALAETVTEKDLVLFALSGGASALMEAPIAGISLDDLQLVNRELLASGATIMTLNAIRSRLSRVKAGGLAKAFQKATVAVIYLSDVEGDRLNVIASGPFVPPTASPDLEETLRAYGLEDRFPKHIVEELRKTPPNDSQIKQPPHRMVGNARMMGEKAEAVAKELGLNPTPALPMFGEAKAFPILLREKGILPVADHSCLISVGETVVQKSGNGLGGRAQEMACVAAQEIQGRSDLAVLVAGSDGTDGPTDAAGALVDGETVARAQVAGFSVEKVLEENNSYHFHQAAGTLVKTGPTGTNLNDLLIFVRAE